MISGAARYNRRIMDISPDTPDNLHDVRTYIDDHLEQPLSVDDLAERAYLSRYHFIRLFRRHFYVTPHQYLMRKRLEKARELLADSELTITEICFAVGFESVGSFSTLFHRNVGWSPSIYRARVWAQRQNPYQFIPGCYCTTYGLYGAVTSLAPQRS